MIIDEFRNLDRSNRRAVLAHFNRLIKSGDIGQVIMADPDVSDIKGLDFVPKEDIAFVEVK